MTDTIRDIIERHWIAANARDWKTFASLLDENMLYEVPQTRERIRGGAGYLDLFRTWPGQWHAEIRQIIVEGNSAVCVIAFFADGEEMTGITFFEFSDGLIVRATDCWPDPYEPPERMSAFFERY